MGMQWLMGRKSTRPVPEDVAPQNDPEQHDALTPYIKLCMTSTSRQNHRMGYLRKLNQLADTLCSRSMLFELSR